MAVVSARNLVKRFGRGRTAREVLSGVGLDVEGGELVAVLGRSGSGKSTLLHLLGGLDRPDAGTVSVVGQRLNGSDRRLTELRRRHVGFVFQAFHLIPELTGEENVLLAARLADAEGSAIHRTRALIGQLGLAPVAGHRPHELSGGEQQRFAIARALVNAPSAILADEPTGNLDSEAAADVIGLLRSIADRGHAVVLATHDPDAVAVADRVLRLHDGRLHP
ncbi:MAG: ABC transporter ATP-binding protein [Actinobacteria bacterium]|nr:ABC transporter ATP-binding protein [Actinomycetota bacterium]